ncbi:inorganic triphosphatase [Rheinheimera sp. WS51]|uniref:CYTH domain-containing protein n=1 Tax=Rheinheimera sp. WS51 TaxID=3425886 RepID=UPI003D8D29BC
MTTELELKYLISAEAAEQLPNLIRPVARIIHSDESKLLNAYFDTADNWFRQHDFGLRSRQKQGQFEQTIKLAGKQHGALQMRPEYNLACAGVIPDLAKFPAEIWPKDSADIVDISQLQQNLIELFRTDFTRKRWLLELEDKTQIELVYDFGQVLAADKAQQISELELEFISGDAKQLFVLARHLIQHLSLQTGWLSKAARGYQLRQGSALSLPADIGQDLLQQITALQQAEACFIQQKSADALQFCYQALIAIAGSLHNHERLQPWYEVAMSLADMAKEDASILGSEQYNLLLLALSEYLFSIIE